MFFPLACLLFILVASYTFLWLMRVDRGCERTNIHRIYLQIRIRLRHMWHTNFYLTPLISSHISTYFLEDRKAPIIDWFTLFLFRIVWIVSGFCNAHPSIRALFVLTGGRWLLSLVHNWAERRAVLQCEAQDPTGFSKQLTIPEYDWENGSPEDFFEKFVKTPHPVILRGFAKNTEAAKQWGFEYFLQNFGDEQVTLTRQELDGYQGKLSEVNDPAVYIHNGEIIFKRHPELLQQLECNRLQPYIKKDFGFSQMFLGRSGTGSPFHCAPIWNFFYMFEGQKTWYFIDPEYTYFAYPFTVAGRVASILLSRYPDNVDLHRLPLFKWCPYYKTTTDPGDVLLLPPWWWHAIRNVTPTSLGVATRWMSQRAVTKEYLFSSENYNINRLFDLQVFLGLTNSVPFFHGYLGNPSPEFDEHATLREKKNRFVHQQRMLIKRGWKF